MPHKVYIFAYDRIELLAELESLAAIMSHQPYLFALDGIKPLIELMSFVNPINILFILILDNVLANVTGRTFKYSL